MRLEQGRSVRLGLWRGWYTRTGEDEEAHGGQQWAMRHLVMVCRGEPNACEKGGSIELPRKPLRDAVPCQTLKYCIGPWLSIEVRVALPLSITQRQKLEPVEGWASSSTSWKAVCVGLSLRQSNLCATFSGRRSSPIHGSSRTARLGSHVMTLGLTAER